MMSNKASLIIERQSMGSETMRPSVVFATVLNASTREIILNTASLEYIGNAIEDWNLQIEDVNGIKIKQE